MRIALLRSCLRRTLLARDWIAEYDANSTLICWNVHHATSWKKIRFFSAMMPQNCRCCNGVKTFTCYLITLTKPSLFVLGALANQNVSNADFIFYYYFVAFILKQELLFFCFCFTTLFFPLFILFSLFSRADVLYWLQADVHMRIYIKYIF